MQTSAGKPLVLLCYFPDGKCHQRVNSWNQPAQLTHLRTLVLSIFELGALLFFCDIERIQKLEPQADFKDNVCVSQLQNSVSCLSTANLMWPNFRQPHIPVDRNIKQVGHPTVKPSAHN